MNTQFCKICGRSENKYLDLSILSPLFLTEAFHRQTVTA